MARAAAEVSSTQRWVSALTTSGAGAVPTVAPADGLVVAVGGHHGVAVDVDMPLVSVSSGPDTLMERRVYDRDLNGDGTPDVVYGTVVHGSWIAARPLDSRANLRGTGPIEAPYGSGQGPLARPREHHGDTEEAPTVRPCAQQAPV